MTEKHPIHLQLCRLFLDISKKTQAQKNSRLKKTQGNFLKNSSLFSKNSRFCQLNLIIFAIHKIITLKWSNFSIQLLSCKFVPRFSTSLVKFFVQKLVHRKSKPWKLKEFPENSRHLRKTHAFSKKTSRKLSKNQGFANSTWYLMRKSVQKNSLHNCPIL